ncbi:DUF4097 family beta strand repeat-containing protein [Pedobacter agri]|uniref:DUF4097 family beta strand repeat-containing protein n=1 Tax=Pedobacter agri TaxID=454586 RepID=UPI00293115B9|nr:DUF4097 family beta strand repeat-containing protein [Pedobacter agri]
MKKQFIVLLSVLSIAMSASAQKQYKLSKSSGQLNLNIPGAIVEGYSGNEIIFSLPKNENEIVDERAKGLRVISASGFVDNTGLGLDVSEKGSEINVNAVNKKIDGVVSIKVPQNIKITFVNQSNIYQQEIILKNLNNEIEISTSYNKIKLENNTGPMNIKSLYGTVDATFADVIKGPVSIVSVYGHVDVSLPANVKANVDLSTSFGKIYAADELKIAIDKQLADDKNNVTVIGKPANSQVTITGVKSATGTINTVRGLAVYGGRSSEDIKGKINGGGSDFILKSNYQNVYLRVK